jgi:hypothetical protein
VKRPDAKDAKDPKVVRMPDAKPDTKREPVKPPTTQPRRAPMPRKR